MALYLGILIFSFIVTSVAIVPFIDFLYRVRLIRKDVNLTFGNRTVLKKGKPTGVGVLLIFLICVLFATVFPLMQRLGVYVVSSFSIKPQLNIIFFTLIGFGLLGLYSDVVRIYSLARNRYFNLIKIALSFVVACLLYFHLGISIVNVPFFGVFNLGLWYIPMATLVVLAFTHAFNVTDGLDGLACGLLMICLLAFWVLSVTFLDTPLSIFIALWIGSLIAFLYFNVYPSRVWLGNSGALAFGATLAVVGLLLGKIVALFVIGGIFMAELASWALKLFPITPLHNQLQLLGWPEPKITLRAWITAVMLAIFGVWLAYL